MCGHLSQYSAFATLSQQARPPANTAVRPVSADTFDEADYRSMLEFKLYIRPLSESLPEYLNDFSGAKTTLCKGLSTNL